MRDVFEQEAYEELEKLTKTLMTDDLVPRVPLLKIDDTFFLPGIDCIANKAVETAVEAWDICKKVQAKSRELHPRQLRY